MYGYLKEENAILERELETILKILFNSIETETYINPLGISAYLKAIYPDRWDRKMESIYGAQGD